jgi:hypothetical protein
VPTYPYKGMFILERDKTASLPTQVSKTVTQLSGPRRGSKPPGTSIATKKRR